MRNMGEDLLTELRASPSLQSEVILSPSLPPDLRTNVFPSNAEIGQLEITLGTPGNCFDL